MSGPVNIIRVEKQAKADLRGHYRVFIDRQPLADWLDDLARQATRKGWRDKSRCLVDIDLLRRSCHEAGQWEIVICANCAASGFKSGGDIGMDPIGVKFTANQISWTVTSPHSQDDEATAISATLNFDRDQYLKAIAKVSD